MSSGWPIGAGKCGSLIASKCGQWGKGGSLWTAETVAESNNWTAVCWAPGNAGTGGAIANPGLFVAVASNGTHGVMTSPDGITWTARTAAEANAWQSVCWAPTANSGNGYFVAVANSGTHRVMTSPDGVTWTARTAAAANGWNGICWSPTANSGSGRFVACAYSTTTHPPLMYSDDGITWSLCTIALYNEEFQGVCWSPDLGKFCVVGVGLDAYDSATSSDGITWTYTIASNNNKQSVCWSPANSIFSTGGAGAASQSSSTGASGSWTVHSLTTTVATAIAWSPDLGIFCVVGNGSASTSSNGVVWTYETSVIPARQFTGVCWSHELNIFCAVGNKAVMIRQQ